MLICSCLRLEAETLTFESYSQKWLEQARLNLKASTVGFYEGHLAQHIVPALGQRAIGELRRADCRDLVTACRTKGLKATTVRGIARTLSTILTQAVEDEWLPANPAFRLGRYLRTGDDAEPEIEPFTRDEVAALLQVARARFPDWYPWLLCGLRTGLRAGELLALQWGDLNWRRSFIEVQRNLVRAQLTTPKNHQRRRVDLSRQLRAELRLWRRCQRSIWLKHGQPFPEWVFASVTGTALDESNVRKAFNRLLDAAGLPSTRSASDAAHVRVAAAAERDADHLRQPTARSQGRVDHAARVRPLDAGRVGSASRRSARRHATIRNPDATDGSDRRSGKTR